MSFIYKNPTSSNNLSVTDAVQREKTYGTNFSVLQTGGYMEVYTLDDLNFTIPAGQTGPIEFTGNTIPINYSKRTLGFLPDNLTLNSDGISSGRRRLGMLVYVHETEQTYQYTITDFDTLWDAAAGSTSEATYGYTVSTSTAGGTEFINAWLDSSIEGISGVTRENARWRIFYGTDITVTGGTYSDGTATFTNSTGGTFNVTGFLTGSTSISAITYNDAWGITESLTDNTTSTTNLPFITGGTYSLGTISLGINNGLESNISITGLDSDDTFITGGTYSPTTLTLSNNDGVDITVTGFAPEITGGTYNSGTLSLLDNTGGSVNITGITFTSTNIYNTDGQLEGNRVIDQDSNSLIFSGGSVSMGTTLQSPVCALLELASTNQGLLIPRMTQVQRLAVNTPLPGLLLFCTDSDSNGAEGLYMYKSQGWVNVL